MTAAKRWERPTPTPDPIEQTFRQRGQKQCAHNAAVARAEIARRGCNAGTVQDIQKGRQQFGYVKWPPPSLADTALGAPLLLPASSLIVRTGALRRNQPSRVRNHNSENIRSAGAAALAPEAPAAMPMHQPLCAWLVGSSRNSPSAVAASPERAAGGVFLGAAA